MDQLRLFLQSLSRRDLDELLGDIRHDGPEGSRGTRNSAEGDNSNFQATIEGMQR